MPSAMDLTCVVLTEGPVGGGSASVGTSSSATLEDIGGTPPDNVQAVSVYNNGAEGVIIMAESAVNVGARLGVGEGLVFKTPGSAKGLKWRFRASALTAEVHVTYFR